MWTRPQEVLLADALALPPSPDASSCQDQNNPPCCPSFIPLCLGASHPLKDATSPTSKVSQRLSSQVFQGERQNLTPPQLLHPPMLNQPLLSQLLFPLHTCTAGHGEGDVTPVQLTCRAMRRAVMELTAQLNPAAQGTSTSCHTAAALQAGDLDMSF